ncbi:hypothetical protein B0T18DRAFT_369884 [Schizothecium vesticola]|uniref:CPAF-like PDZ domain-containing protein n=1 Tax=Schizothecium vesticola TaxID=314040 RepID=A0AA40EX35_9PEZI|nr:hypothetical protein B0T18DRAFT_369884 [Schizothecium vesticola]
MKSALLVSAALGAVARLSHASPLTRRADEPCGQLRDAVDKWYRDNNIVPKSPTNPLEAAIIPAAPAAPVLPSLAFACLRSVPLDKETALKHIEHLKPQWQWHSTIEYLKNPPWGYLSEPVDLLGGLDEIKAKLQGDAYRSEFDFLADLHMLSRVRVRDSHFHAGSALMDLFTFKTGAEFVSVSKDGVSLPEIFVQEDIKHDKEKYSPSAVSTIDGIPALTYLKTASSLAGGAHDPDARYNEVTWSLAKASTYYPSDNGIHDLGFNDTTTVQFQNKTVRIFSNTAFVRANLTNVTSAASLYSAYGRGEGAASLPLAWNAYTRIYEQNFTSAWSGYPTPANRTFNGGAAGFLPTAPKLKDTVVLAVTTFDNALNPSDAAGFLNPEWRLWNMTAAVLTRARAEKRTKLILDMQSNTGGYIATMTALYFALFPPAAYADPFPFLFQARAHPQLAWLVDRFTSTAAPNTTKWIWNFINAQQYLDPATRKPFPSFAAWYGPPSPAQPHLTPPFGMNLTQFLDSTFWPHLDPPNAPFTTQFFKPEDILILTDGVCGSACAIFVDTLSRLHGVRTVAVGGRPLNKPMQAVGRVRGGPAVSFQTWDSGVLGKKWEVPAGLELAKEGGAPLRMAGGGMTTFNLLNMRDPNDGGDAPLQFTYTAADCRVWWTWEMGRGMERVWEKAGEVTWGGGRCVEGSTGRNRENIGYLGYSEAVKDEVKLGEGPGSVRG